MSVTVRVTDNETGEEETQVIRDGDYLLIVTDPAELTHTQVYRGGATHVLTVKHRIVG